MKTIHVPAADLLAATRSLPEHDRAEMAVPSYTHWNPLIRWLFWSRLKVSLQLAHLVKTDRVFEYGTGTGVLLPSLHHVAERVAATDIYLAPSKELANRMQLQTEFVELG